MSASGNGATVLALNSGSSSLKFAVFEPSGGRLNTLVTGEATTIGGSERLFRVNSADGKERLRETSRSAGSGNAVARIAGYLEGAQLPTPVAIGHRIVHGGPDVRAHCLVDGPTLRHLQEAVAFAPLHLPPALSVLSYALECFPQARHVACLDTVFHASLPDVARILPIAKELRTEGVERYGFHGLSCESVIRGLARPLPRRIVIAHLGNGCSLTAVEAGRSIDTSMGLTPTGGVIMGTRPGDLDPGVLLYLLRRTRINARELEAKINQRSGLLGISELTHDMRDLHSATRCNRLARLAIEMFCYSLRKGIAGMIAALGGADLIVFTGGIGENDAAVRAMICEGLECFGVCLDVERNRLGSNLISDIQSRISVQVIHSREEEEIARHTREVLACLATKPDEARGSALTGSSARRPRRTEGYSNGK